MVRLTINGIVNWGMIDTAAKSICVDEAWFTSIGGSIMDDEGGAEAADGITRLRWQGKHI